MKKEKVFIVLSHKHILKPGSRTEWELTESVEFVNQLRNKHLTMSSAIGDYINRKMQSGDRVGMGEYSKFEAYIRKEYNTELSKLDDAYGSMQVPATEIIMNDITDVFGNTRQPTVFDTNNA